MEKDNSLTEYQKIFNNLKELRKKALNDESIKEQLKREVIKGLKSEDKSIINDTIYSYYGVFWPKELFKVIMELVKDEKSSQYVPLILNKLSGDFDYDFEEFNEIDKKTILERYEHFYHLGYVKFLEELELEYFDCKVDLSTMKNLDNLKNLKRLSFDHVDIKELPNWIGNLKFLQELEIYDNYLTNLPESIGNLTSLKKLEISMNKLESLPESIGNLHSLETLDLHMNQLSSLPTSIGNLLSLKNLDLSYNRFKTLPESLGNLHKLEKFNSSNKTLSTLPASIGNLKLLQELNLDRIELIILPSSMMNLISLKRITIRETKIANPEVLKVLRKKGIKIIK